MFIIDFMYFYISLIVVCVLGIIFTKKYLDGNLYFRDFYLTLCLPIAVSMFFFRSVYTISNLYILILGLVCIFFQESIQRTDGKLAKFFSFITRGLTWFAISLNLYNIKYFNFHKSLMIIVVLFITILIFLSIADIVSKKKTYLLFIICFLCAVSSVYFIDNNLFTHAYIVFSIINISYAVFYFDRLKVSRKTAVFKAKQKAIRKRLNEN